MVAVVVKFCESTTWPARSGWLVWMPQSSTATVTPVPSVVSQAVGAPIFGSPHCCGNNGSSTAMAAVATRSG